MSLVNSTVKMVIIVLFEKVLFPLGEEYVKRTDNDWDDKALVFLQSLYKYVMTKI